LLAYLLTYTKNAKLRSEPCIGVHPNRMYVLSLQSVHLISGRNVLWLVARCLLVSHGEYAADVTDGQTDGRQTVTLRFPIVAAHVLMPVLQLR